MVNPPPPAAGNAVAGAPISREDLEILRAYRFSRLEFPSNLDIAMIRSHFTPQENRMADRIEAVYQTKVGQIPVHPGIDVGVSLDNPPLFGAAGHVGLATVTMGSKDASKIESISNLLRLIKSLRTKDREGNALVQVEVCSTKELIRGAGRGGSRGTGRGGGAGRGAGAGAGQGVGGGGRGNGNRFLDIVSENLRVCVSNACGKFDFTIRTVEGRAVLIIRDLVLILHPTNPDRQKIERAFEARYTLLMSLPDVFALLAFPQQFSARNFCYGAGMGSTRYAVLEGMAHVRAGGTHTPTFGVVLPGLGWFCIGPIFNSACHTSLPVVPGNPPSDQFRIFVPYTNMLVRGGDWFFFSLSNLGGRSAFTLKGAGMSGVHITDESVYAAIYCADLLAEAEMMKAFNAAGPGEEVTSPSIRIPRSLIPGVTSPFMARIFTFNSLAVPQRKCMLALGGYPDFAPVPNLPVGGIVIRSDEFERHKTVLVGGATFFDAMFHDTESPVRGALIVCSLDKNKNNFDKMKCVDTLTGEILNRMKNGGEDGSDIELTFEVCRHNANSSYFSMTNQDVKIELLRSHIAEKAKNWNGLGL